MAGTVKADVLQSEQSTPTVFRNTSGTEIGQLTKAWCNYNGLTPIVNGSFNVSSVTRNGTGDYTNNLTTSVSNSNYCIGSSVGDTSSNLADDDGGAHPYILATSSYRFYSGYGLSSGNIQFYNYTLVHTLLVG
jgi:hypothetical protein